MSSNESHRKESPVCELNRMKAELFAAVEAADEARKRAESFIKEDDPIELITVKGKFRDIESLLEDGTAISIALDKLLSITKQKTEELDKKEAKRKEVLSRLSAQVEAKLDQLLSEQRNTVIALTSKNEDLMKQVEELKGILQQLSGTVEGGKESLELAVSQTS